MSSQILFLEGGSGISGDMTVAALLSLGASQEKLEKALASLHVDGFEIKISNGKQNGIAGIDFDVILTDHHHHHDHAHNHGHEHAHNHHHHEERNLNAIYAIIENGHLNENVKSLSKKIFNIVAEAESKAHGVSIEEVHFHEVGAIDSIVDIIAAAVCIDDLGITECVVTKLCEGQGFVRCQHGNLPVPVPAVAEIAARHQIALHTLPENGELVTPTGIAIAAALKTSSELPAQYHIKKVGIGLGKKKCKNPNILRALLLEVDEKAVVSTDMYILESNIDDSTGEELGFAMEKLFEVGALDVHYLPCFMKKNRPGWLLRVIARGRDLDVIHRAIFKYTTTIGVRRTLVDRSGMTRQPLEITLDGESVNVKKCVYEDIVRYYPEFESIKNFSEKTGSDFKSAFHKAAIEAEKNDNIA